MLDMVGVGKRVLELGCSNGYMSRLLKQRNCQVTGVEIDPLAAAEARSFCEEVIVADLDSRPLVDLLPGTPFDAAVFGDVLEHLRDPWRVLDEARAFLPSGSFAVLSIPNVAHGSVRLALLRGSFDYQPQGLLDSTHLRFFTLRSVRELCMRSGYRIEEIRRTKAELFAATDLLPALDPNDFDPDLIAQVRSDPEHDTVQFIVKAVPLSDEERISEIVSRVSQLESESHARTEKNLRLQAELNSLREEASGLSALYSQLLFERQTTESDVRRDVDAAKEETGRLQADLDTLREQAAGLTAQYNGASLALEETKNELDRLTSELRERSEDVAGLSAALSSSLTARERMAADLRYLEAKNEELESARSQIEQLQGERESLAIALEDEKERSQVLSDRGNEFSERASGLQIQLELAHAQFRELRSQFDVDRKTLSDTMTRRVEMLETELLKVNEEKAASEAALGRVLRSSIEEVRTELSRILEEIALTDAAIQETYASRAWALKRLLSRFLSRPLRRAKRG
jgi:SAM-dependent methyltransferase/predicted  nucleic acid-binding Zn-ribbon protein